MGLGVLCPRALLTDGAGDLDLDLYRVAKGRESLGRGLRRGKHWVGGGRVAAVDIRWAGGCGRHLAGGRLRRGMEAWNPSGGRV